MGLRCRIALAVVLGTCCGMGCGALVSSKEGSAQIHDEAQLLSTYRAASKHVIPDYWTNKYIEDGKFDDMFYVPRAEYGKFDRFLQKTYVAGCTQDRPCPNHKCSKQRGGCPATSLEASLVCPLITLCAGSFVLKIRTC